MKSTTSALSAPFVLKVVGYVLLLSTLVDYVTLISPMKWQEEQWLVATLTQLVERGFIPLVAIAFIYVSGFLENRSLVVEGRSSFMTGRFYSMVISAILGLIFLATIVINFTYTNKLATVETDRIAKQSQLQEQQVQAGVQQRLLQFQEQFKDKTRLEAGLKELNDAVTSGQINGRKIEPLQLEQLKKDQKNLQKVKDDPNHLQTMAKEASDEELQKVRENKQKAEEQIQSAARRTSLKTGLNSLLLSIAFSLISWLGLSELGIFSKR